MLLLVAVLASVALGASAALVGLTITLGHETALVGQADARMRASLRTRAALLWFARESDLAASRRSPAALDAQSSAEAELRAAVDETRRLATPDRVVPLDNLVRKSGEFIALRKRLQSQGLPVDVILEGVTASLDSVLHDLDDLVAADDLFSRTEQVAARRLSAMAIACGASAAGLLLLGFAISIIASRRLIERPILALNRAVELFACGDSQSRVAPAGVFEVQRIGRTFNDLAERVQRQEKDRLTFLACVAHDLRGPLTPLKLVVGTIGRAPGPPSPETSSRVLSVVRRQVDRLDQMVGDLLDVTRIQSGELELTLRSTDLRPLVAGVADLYRPVSEPCRIAVVMPDVPVMTPCDPLRIEQVLINLVSNAIKYSPEGGLITIRLAVEGGEAVVRVSDEGVGIDANEREEIFQPFRRGEKSRKLTGGMGLGLSSSRRIAQAHGGRLEVESPVRGATFRLSLRLEPGEAGVAHPNQSERRRVATRSQ